MTGPRVLGASAGKGQTDSAQSFDDVIGGEFAHEI
jgi:hypothetical protein